MRVIPADGAHLPPAAPRRPDEASPSHIRAGTQGSDQLLPEFFSKQEIDRLGEQIDNRHGRIFRERYRPRVRPFPGVRELFDRIASEGLFIALASSADREDLEHYKQLAGIEDRVDHQVTSEDADQSKPHPDLFAVAMGELVEIFRDPADLLKRYEESVLASLAGPAQRRAG